MDKIIRESNIKDILLKYAESIIEYFDNEILKCEYDDIANEMNYAINNNQIVFIPEIYREDSFELSRKMLKEDPVMAEMKHLDRFSEGLSRTILETDNLMNLMESAASSKAKKLGLVHKGFGNYSDSDEGGTEYKTINGKLVPFKGGEKKAKKSEPDPPAKEKEIKKDDANEKPKEDDEDEKEKKKIIKGISSIHRSKGDKFTYYFEFDSVPSSITLTPKEYKSGKPIKAIIQYKIDHRREMKRKLKKTKEMKKRERIEREKKFKPTHKIADKK